jgi:DNA-binding transcriptional MerR regulator
LWRFALIPTNSLDFGLTLEESKAYVPAIEESDEPQAMSSSNDLYRTQEVVEILGISQRQLQYWAQTDLIVPSAETPGGHGRYTFEDLVALRAAKRLIDSGVSVQRIRKLIRGLKKVFPAVESPLAKLILVATGDAVLAFRDGAAFDAVSGQEWVFEVAQFQREIEEWRRSIETLSTVGKARTAGRSGVRDQSA